MGHIKVKVENSKLYLSLNDGYRHYFDVPFSPHVKTLRYDKEDGEGQWKWKISNDEYFLEAAEDVIILYKNGAEIFNEDTPIMNNAKHIEYFCEKLREIYQYGLREKNEFFKHRSHIQPNQ